MLYSCCAPLSQAELIRKAGYDAIILAGTAVAAMEAEEIRAAGARLKALGLPCNALNTFCPDDIRFLGPGRDLDKLRRYCKALMPKASELGVRFIGIGGPKSRHMAPGYVPELAKREMRETLGLICMIAREHGITVLLEAVCSLECNFINTTAEALEIVEKAGIENLRLVFDSYHAYMMEEDGEALKRALPLVALMHVAHDIQGVRRCPQGDFASKHHKYFDILLQGGFHGEIGVEAAPGSTNEEIRTALPVIKAMAAKAAR